MSEEYLTQIQQQIKASVQILSSASKRSHPSYTIDDYNDDSNSVLTASTTPTTSASTISTHISDISSTSKILKLLPTDKEQFSNYVEKLRQLNNDSDLKASLNEEVQCPGSKWFRYHHLPLTGQSEADVLRRFGAYQMDITDLLQ
ncbi:hypothetical protein HPULCUR_012156 [Helicostylum pulchrum]|uniref:Uncharacterized protein n=1 Tax=Helicostylum pulchrum TaxID=562976 RepID=A0ABP9YID8_9FUNG